MITRGYYIQKVRGIYNVSVVYLYIYGMSIV